MKIGFVVLHSYECIIFVDFIDTKTKKAPKHNLQWAETGGQAAIDFFDDYNI